MNNGSLWRKLKEFTNICSLTLNVGLNKSMWISTNVIFDMPTPIKFSDSVQKLKNKLMSVLPRSHFDKHLNQLRTFAGQSYTFSFSAWLNRIHFRCMHIEAPPQPFQTRPSVTESSYASCMRSICLITDGWTFPSSLPDTFNIDYRVSSIMIHIFNQKLN